MVVLARGVGVSYGRGTPVLQAVRPNEVAEPVTHSEAGSYLRLIDSCITQLKAQAPSRTCNESKKEEESPFRGRPKP